MSEIIKIDINLQIDRINRLQYVLDWIKNVAYNQTKLNNLEKGIDTDIYDKDRLSAKREKLMEKEDLLCYLTSAQMKIRIMELDDLMTYHREVAIAKNVDMETRKESAFLMNDLSDEYKELNKKYDESLYEIEPELYREFAKIYDMIINGTSLDTVKHAFRTFAELQNGKITINQAANRGLDYEESRGAPEGFFDFALEGQRLRQGKKSKKYNKIR